MKIGRNEICPCGSGKKYKKCCLGKPLEDNPANDELLRNEEDLFDDDFPPELRKALNEVEPKLSPLKEPEQLEYFLAQIAAKPDLDPMLVIAMSGYICQMSEQHETRAKIFETIESLSKQYPDLYNPHKLEYLSLLVGLAIGLAEIPLIDRLMKEFATLADQEYFLFAHALDLLIIAEYLSVVAEVIPIALETLSKSDSVPKEWLEAFTVHLLYFNLLNYYETHPDMDIQELKDCCPTWQFFEDQQCNQLLAHLKGTAETKWSLKDFSFAVDIKAATDSPEVDRELNFLFLTFDFLHYMHQTQHLSYAKAESLRSHIFDYVKRRNAGLLKTSNAKKHHKKQFLPANPFAVDLNTLGNFLVPQAFNSDLSMALFVEGLPKWLQFLREKQLLTEYDYKRYHKEISKLEAKIFLED